MDDDMKKLIEDGKKIINTPDRTAEFEEEDIKKNKVLALFSYIWILFLIPLFAAKDSKFAKFHVKQGIVLFVLDTVGGAIVTLFCLFIAKLPLIGEVLPWVIGTLFSLIVLALIIWGVYYAVNGRAKEFPLITSVDLLKDLLNKF